jgi:hypothetical protein
MSSTKIHRMVLEHLDGARKGEVEVYVRETITIGRAMDCDLHFPNEKSTSPHHAVIRIQHQDGQTSFELLDTQSTNGTYVNQNRVEQVPLKIGDIVRFGVLGPQVKFSLQILQANETPVEIIKSEVIVAKAPEPAWRYVRNAAMLYVGGSVAAVGVADAVFDRYALNAKWFSAFLIFLVGGLVSTLVEAWYRSAPGRQKFQWWEAALHLGLLVGCTIAASIVLAMAKT